MDASGRRVVKAHWVVRRAALRSLAPRIGSVGRAALAEWALGRWRELVVPEVRSPVGWDGGRSEPDKDHRRRGPR